MGDLVEQFLRKIPLEGHTLGKSITVSHQQEDQLTLIGAVIHPPLQGYFLAFKLGELGNFYDGGHKLTPSFFTGEAFGDTVIILPL